MARITMSDLLLAKIAVVPEIHWTISQAEDGEVRWLPLVSISKSGLWLGINQVGAWVLGRIGGSAAVASPWLPQAWLTILDSEESVIKAELAAAAYRYDLPGELIAERLPIDEVLTMALAEPSEHWAGRAVAWLTSRDIHRDHVALLGRLATARWASQRTRQTASRLLRNG
jgi:hypothetical protein